MEIKLVFILIFLVDLLHQSAVVLHVYARAPGVGDGTINIRLIDSLEPHGAPCTHYRAPWSDHIGAGPIPLSTFTVTCSIISSMPRALGVLVVGIACMVPGRPLSRPGQSLHVTPPLTSPISQGRHLPLEQWTVLLTY